MSSSLNENSTVIPDNDVAILEDVIAVCEDGRQLYQHVADQVTDQQSRSFFSEMAKVRAKIVKELEDRAPNGATSQSAAGSVAKTVRKWYADAAAKFRKDEEIALIEQIEANEKQSLSVLKKAVKNVQDKTLAQRLASLTASFQMALDQMKYLKETYR